MQPKQLATSLNKSIRDVEEAMADIGVSIKTTQLSDDQAQAIASKLGANTLPSLPQAEPEPAKKGRKTGGRIAKAKQQSLVETAAASNLQSTHEINELVKQGIIGGAAIADIVSGATYQGYMARKSANDAVFFEQICSTSMQQLQDQLAGVDFQKNLQELGIALPSQTLEKSTQVKASAEILNDTASLAAKNWMNYDP